MSDRISHIGANAYKLSGQGLVSRAVASRDPPPLSAYRIRTPSTVRNRTGVVVVVAKRHILPARATVRDRELHGCGASPLARDRYLQLAILDSSVTNSIPNSRDPSGPWINRPERQQVGVRMREDHVFCASHLLAQVIELRLLELFPHGRHQNAPAAVLVGLEDVQQLSDKLRHVRRVDLAPLGKHQQVLHALVVAPQVLGQPGRTQPSAFHRRVQEGALHRHMGGYLLDQLTPRGNPVRPRVTYPIEQPLEITVLPLEHIHGRFPHVKSVPRYPFNIEGAASAQFVAKGSQREKVGCDLMPLADGEHRHLHRLRSPLDLHQVRPAPRVRRRYQLIQVGRQDHLARRGERLEAG